MKCHIIISCSCIMILKQVPGILELGRWTERWAVLNKFWCRSVLVCLGCHNKIPQSGWLLNNRSYFSQLWRLEVQFWGRPSSWFTLAPSQCRHRAEGSRERCGVLCLTALIPFTRAPPLCPKHFPKASPSNTITFGG